MKIFGIFAGIFFALFSWMIPVAFAENPSNALENVNYTIQWDVNRNTTLEEFSKSVNVFYKSDSDNNKDTVNNLFLSIAKNIKDFFILAAVCFLVFGVIKLFFSDASDDDTKRWKNNIVWTSIGIFFMQFAYYFWSFASNLEGAEYGQNPLNAMTGWQFWEKILEPLIGLLGFFASFAFFAMLIYAFYSIVTSAGDEEKLKTGKNALLFGIIGFIMIQLPQSIVKSLYRGLPWCENRSNTLWSLSQTGCDQMKNGDFSEAIMLVGKLIQYFNRFLMLFCVIMAIYAGWLLFISRGSEDKVKQAKNIILYTFIGFVLLIASHAIFRFYLLEKVA